MGSSKIFQVKAREIIDSRGNPTVETECILESGYRGTSSVPSGTAIGPYEVKELRDGDKDRYKGMGVLKAINNVNTLINEKIKGIDALDQKAVDDAMINLDGTSDKSKLGANAILSVSQAVTVAAGAFSKEPLYKYINKIFSQLLPTQTDRIPIPMFNVINGGLHGAGNLNFQEFLIIPASNKSYPESLQMGVETYFSVRDILKYRNAIHSTGDEGGFAPNLFTNLDAFEVIVEAVQNTKNRLGVDIYLGLDVAATHFKTKAGYLIKDRPAAFNRDEFINYLINLHGKYHLLILEDALEEDDWEGWVSLTQKIGTDVLIVGDDFLATNPDRLKKAIDQKACSGILGKPIQIGTVSEFLQVIRTAKENNIKTFVSHRSGETTDTFLADLAVGIQADYVKFGAPARGERVVKYNRLSQIENEIKSK